MDEVERMNKLSSAIWTPSAPTSLAVVALLVVRNIGSGATARVNRLISAHKILQFTGQAIDQYDPTERANPIFIGVKPGTLRSETAPLAESASKCRLYFFTATDQDQAND
jgi:hypothetical protein